MRKKKNIIIFTDLDGSLLNHTSFKFDEIKNYLRDCLKKGIKIIPNSSKTALEIQDFINDLNYKVPFISENGSTIQNLNIYNSNLSGEIKLAKNIDEIQSIIDKNFSNSLLSNCNFLNDMETNDQSKILGLTNNKLKMALNRKHTVLLDFKGSEIEKENLKLFCRELDLSLNEGGRVISIGDQVNKALAMKKVLDLLSNFKEFENVYTIGVGDSPNDLEMLNNVEFPCLVKNKNNKNLIINENYTISSVEAPLGWLEVVKIALEKIH